VFSVRQLPAESRHVVHIGAWQLPWLHVWPVWQPMQAWPKLPQRVKLCAANP
jgi:hypothetical protein